MANYHSIDEISVEIGVNQNTLYQKARILGIDTQKITKTAKNKLIEACKGTIGRKTEAKEFEKVLKSIKVTNNNKLVGKSGDELKIMLDLAKIDFDNNQRQIMECETAISEKGTIIITPTNSTICSNPAVKTKIELMKAQSVLRKDIIALQEALKVVVNFNDSESPFRDE